MKATKRDIDSKLKITDLGRLNQFLWVKGDKYAHMKTVRISKEKYSTEILASFCMRHLKE